MPDELSVTTPRVKQYERQSYETALQFEKFRLYLALGKEVREVWSVERVANHLKESGATASNDAGNLSRLMMANKWKFRAERYDADFPTSNIPQVISPHYDNTNTIKLILLKQLSGIHDIINHKIQTYKDDPDTLAPRELQSLLSAIEKADSLMRRANGLPTSYQTKTVTDSEIRNEAVEYVIGDDDE